MIDVEGLVLERPWGRVLHDVGFVARTGVATALVGPPGAGKSALMRCLATLEPPQAGRILIAGVDPSADPRSAHARLGYVAQQFGLYDALSVGRCLEHAAGMRGLPRGLAVEASTRAAERFGLVGQLARPAGELGPDARLRVVLAQAVVHGPRVLLLDEPMAALAPLTRSMIAGGIAAVAAEGVTVLVAATTLSELDGCCRDLLTIEGGRVVGPGVRRDGAVEAPRLTEPLG